MRERDRWRGMTGVRAANTLALTPSLVPPAAPKMAAKM